MSITRNRSYDCASFSYIVCIMLLAVLDSARARCTSLCTVSSVEVGRARQGEGGERTLAPQRRQAVGLIL